MKYMHNSLYIGGEWQPSAGGGTISCVSPIDETVVGSAPLAAPADVDKAVNAACTALTSPQWSDLTPDARADLLERFADELDKNAAERAAITTIQNGAPIAFSRWAEGSGVVDLLRYYVELARTTPIEEHRPRVDGAGTTIVRKEPVGVVAAIVPWNAPQFLTMTKVAPALAAGCTVVIKPAPETTLDSFALAAAAERAGIPAGVLNIVTGGAEIGEYLVTHVGVNKVAFTGSTTAGRRVGELCGKLLRSTSLELGGKSAAIVLDDADLASTIEGLALASLINNGQVCFLSTRILAPESRHSEVLEAVGALAESLTVGDPFDEAVHVGPVVSQRQRNRIEAYIQDAKANGSTVVAGGGRVDCDKGYYVQPTVFGGVSNDDKIAREEIFGPVLTVISYRDVDEAVAIANDSDYGLGGTVWTSDQEKGIDVARRVESGTVGVNFYNLDYGSPFGGVKGSGMGRELGPEGLASYFQLKSIFTLG